MLFIIGFMSVVVLSVLLKNLLLTNYRWAFDIIKNGDRYHVHAIKVYPFGITIYVGHNNYKGFKGKTIADIFTRGKSDKYYISDGFVSEENALEEITNLSIKKHTPNRVFLGDITDENTEELKMNLTDQMIQAKLDDNEELELVCLEKILALEKNL